VVTANQKQGGGYWGGGGKGRSGYDVKHLVPKLLGDHAESSKHMLQAYVLKDLTTVLPQ
jgi:hypothetical protein